TPSRSGNGLDLSAPPAQVGSELRSSMLCALEGRVFGPRSRPRSSGRGRTALAWNVLAISSVASAPPVELLRILYFFGVLRISTVQCALPTLFQNKSEPPLRCGEGVQG